MNNDISIGFYKTKLNEIQCYYINKQHGLKRHEILKYSITINNLKLLLRAIRKRMDTLQYYNIYDFNIDMKNVKSLYYYVKHLNKRFISNDLKKYYVEILTDIIKLIFEEKEIYDRYKSDLNKPIFLMSDLYSNKEMKRFNKRW